MNDREQSEMVEVYLRKLARELSDVPRRTRADLLDDVRGHIAEAWETSPDKSPQALQAILARLGAPEELARQEREGLRASEPAWRGADWLAVLAIVLTAAVWPVGIALVWLLPRWGKRDKAIATALPLIGLLLPAPLLRALLPNLQGSGAIALGEWLAQVGFWCAPQIAAVLLALRQRPRTRWGLVLGVVGLALVLVVVVVSSGTWLPAVHGIMAGGPAEVTVEVQPLP